MALDNLVPAICSAPGLCLSFEALHQSVATTRVQVDSELLALAAIAGCEARARPG